MPLDTETKILIVGGGTFGLSAALWLKRKQYQNVTVIDCFDIPSDLSAANDINKIIQSSYADNFHDKLANESLQMWKTDEVFKKHFHDVGIVYSSVSESSMTELNELNARRIENGKTPLKKLEKKKDFHDIIPALTGSLENWKGFYQESDCGWANAKASLISAAEAFIGLGGNIVVAKVRELKIEEGFVKGCYTENGKLIRCEKLILSAGASSVNILNFEDQLLAKCWTLAHIKLSDEEALELKNSPVMLNFDLGFFFEADSNNEVKICNEFPGYTNYIEGKEQRAENSIPILKDSIPLEAEIEIRNLLKKTLPQYADREFVKKKICWCTDTPNRFFLIDEHPDYNGSLVLATGDSGHGFKFMPVIGKYISELVIEGKNKVDSTFYSNWAWRPETTKNRLQDRYGGDGGEDKDLKDIKLWI